MESPTNEVREWTVHHLPLSLTTLQDQVGCEALELNHATVPEVSPHTTASDEALPCPRPPMTARKQAVNLNFPMRRRTPPPPHKDEDAEAGKGKAEFLSDGQAASNGKEGQGCTQTQNTLTGISHVFGMHKETDAESDTGEIQSIQKKRRQPSPKEDMPSKTQVSHLPWKGSQPTRLSMTRPSNGLGSWTQILMLGVIRRLLKASWAGPQGSP